MALVLFCSLSPPPHSLFNQKKKKKKKNTYDSFYYTSRGSTRNHKLIAFSQPHKRGNGTNYEGDEKELMNNVAVEIPERDFVTITACAVGLLTGLAVVLFNIAVHEIRDIFWDGIPLRGTSWLREEPTEQIWQRVILVPVSGGIIVGLLNTLRSSLTDKISQESSPKVDELNSLRPSLKDEISEESSEVGNKLLKLKGVFRPLLKAVAASITLGTGNSLGPEGPSVEIGSNIAKGFSHLLKWSEGKRLSLVAAGSAAGISSGFNASVAGCFFAVESVLWPSSNNNNNNNTSDTFSSLPNATPIVILSSVIASVISQVGLGSDPAFIVPQYDFRSPTELPLYLLLGIICGLISLTLSNFTQFSLQTISKIQKTTKLPEALFPSLGGLLVGLISLKYPEVLYWGFENVDILLESRPFTNGLSTSVLIQLVGVKIIATGFCRATGLVGGFYAPSLFIGAATGMAYGRIVKGLFEGPEAVFHVGLLDVASSQAYGLVGMAATLAGVCQVPLTSVLLLFELTQDYRIVLPLLGAVGLSSWISSSRDQNKSKNNNSKLAKIVVGDVSSNKEKLCLLDSSLCVYEENYEFLSGVLRIMTVSQAMRRRYVSVSMESPVLEVVNKMIQEKDSFVIIVDNDGCLLGLLTLDLVQDFIRSTIGEKREVGEILVSDICEIDEKKCQVSAVTTDMSLINVQNMLDTQNFDRLVVVSSDSDHAVGVIDRDSINIALRAVVTKEMLSSFKQGE